MKTLLMVLSFALLVTGSSNRVFAGPQDPQEAYSWYHYIQYMTTNDNETPEKIVDSYLKPLMKAARDDRRGGDIEKQFQRERARLIGVVKDLPLISVGKFNSEVEAIAEHYAYWNAELEKDPTSQRAKNMLQQLGEASAFLPYRIKASELRLLGFKAAIALKAQIYRTFTFSTSFIMSYFTAAIGGISAAVLIDHVSVAYIAAGGLLGMMTPIIITAYQHTLKREDFTFNHDKYHSARAYSGRETFKSSYEKLGLDYEQVVASARRSVCELELTR